MIVTSTHMSIKRPQEYCWSQKISPNGSFWKTNFFNPTDWKASENLPVGWLTSSITSSLPSWVIPSWGYLRCVLETNSAPTWKWCTRLPTGLAKSHASYLRSPGVRFSEPTEVNINQLVLEMGKLFRSAIDEDVELVMLFASDLVPVTVDPNQIEQVLMNLVVNARDAMPKWWEVGHRNRANGC